jgi:hypothetical protein
MIYDFHNGFLAKQIKKLTLEEIKKNSNYFFEPIENIRYAEVDKEESIFL